MECFATALQQSELR